MTPIRLAIVVTHPIQHFVHFYRALAREPDMVVKVFFCSRIGVDAYFDQEMKTLLSWNMDLLSGYDHEFLPEAQNAGIASSQAVDNPSIAGRLAAFAPSAVLTYGFATRTALRTIAWCRFRRVPLLMTGDTDDVARAFTLRNLARSVALPVLLSQVQAFLTVGDQNESALRRLGVPRAKFFRSPFTIDEAAYGVTGERRAALRAQTRARFAIPDEAFVALYVGKLSPRKRPGDLIEAARRLSAQTATSPLHVLVCGNGELFEAMNTAVEAAKLPVSMAGFVNVDDLPAFFAAADVLVHPASRDPHPLVCSEAAIGGLPMILSDLVGAIGPSDIARPEVNAVVYPCGDIDALMRAMTVLASDPGRAAAMGRASRDVFEGGNNVVASVAGMRAALTATVRQPRAS